MHQGVISPVNESEDVPITSPIVLVSKRVHENKTNTNENTSKESSLSKFRFCCDFRYLNSQCANFNNYSIPDLTDLTESFSNKKPNLLTSVDLNSGFFLLPISKDSQRFTAFNTCFGTFKFLRLPMGLSSSPSSFQLLMDKVLKGLTFKSCLCYLDDILIASETFDQHIQDLDEVFTRLKQAGLKLGPKKCSFAENSCIYLGHKISNKGIEPPPDRVKAIEDYPAPTSVRELRRLVGLLNWFRKYIKNFSSEMEPLTRLLKKFVLFEWTNEHQKAFDKVKSLLINSPVLAFPDYNLPFRLAVDTSSKGIGYMLYQKSEASSDEQIHVIRFGSKTLSKWQKSYGPTKLELLGMVTAILECSSYLRTKPFTVECDHQALRPLFQNKLRGAIYERWIAILQQYNFEIKYKPAREMQVADALSRCSNNSKNTFDSPEEQDPYFPYENENVGNIVVPEGKSFSDLLCNNSSNAEDNLQINNICVPTAIPKYPILIVPIKNADLNDDTVYDGDTEEFDENSKHFHKLRKFHHLRQKQPRQIRVKSDTNDRNSDKKQSNTEETRLSDQIFNQSTDYNENQFYRQDTANNDSHMTASDMTNNDTMEQGNTSVDSDSNIDILKSIEIFQEKGFNANSLRELQRNDTYCKPYIQYLENDTLPKLQKDARKLLLLVPNFHLINGLLFHSRNRKSVRSKVNNNLQLVIPEILVKTIIQLHHDSTLGGHSGIQNTLDLIQDQYYFPRLSEQVTNYIRSCPECQSRKNTTLKSKTAITSFPTPSAPFEVWEVDLQYGPVPISRSGNSYIFTAVDLFSKYLFAEPIPNTDPLTVANAFFKLVTQFGICKTIISDQGSEFISKCFREVCRLLDIVQEYTPSFAHHCLGACERPHRTISERLTPYLVKGKPWEDVLPGIVFSINNTPNSTLKFSPFEIVYGTRPKFPLSLHVKDTDFSSLPKDCHSYLKNHVEKLNIIRKEVEKTTLNSKLKMLERANNDKIPNISGK